jgi:hypothetical protein
MRDEMEGAAPLSELRTPNSEPFARRFHPSSLILHPFFAYAVLVLALFHRLFLGEVLDAGADIHAQPPFLSVAPDDFKVYTNTIQGDAWRQHGAWQQFQYEAAKEGRFPQWNSFEYMGMPFHGNGQTALFHPFSWPFYFFEAASVRGPLACFRLWLSAAAMYVLLRRWNLGVGAAFLGGACWMFAPFNIRWLHWPLAHSSLWLPIMVLALDRLVVAEGVRSRLRALVVASLAAVVLQLSGHPETQFQAGVAAGVTVLIRSWSLGYSIAASMKAVAWCFAAMILGALGAAAQLLPFLVQLPDSADWVKHFHASPTGLDPKALLLFLSHTFWGQTRADGRYEGPANYIEAGVGIGMIPLALALASLLLSMRAGSFSTPHRRTVWGIWFAVLAFLSLIFHLPVVADFLVKLPLFDQANRCRWTLATQFWLSILAAFGADAFARDARRNGRTAAVLLVLLAALLAGLMTQRIPSRFSKINTAFKQEHWREVVQHAAVRSALGLACAVGASIWLLRRSRTAGPASIVGLCVWTSLEGLCSAWDFNATAPRAMAEPPPPPLLKQAIALAGPGRMIGTNEVLFPNTSVKYGFRDVSGYDWPLPLRLERALSEMGWRVVDGTSLYRQKILPAPSPSLAAFLSRCCVRVVYTNYRQEGPVVVNGIEWPQVATGAVMDGVYFNPAALPRVRFAKKPMLGDEEAAFEALRSPDLSSPSVVEGAEPVAEGEGEATIRQETHERIEIAVRCTKLGVLVLADRMAPGWKVSVDGESKPTLTVDYLFRGVSVPAGDHTVVWSYEAPGFRSGLWMSGGVAAMLVILMAVSFSRRR